MHSICRMSAELPQGQYGPKIGYREYSLLNNPRFHAAHVQPGGNPKLAPPRLAPAVVQVCEVRAGIMKALLCTILWSNSFFILHFEAACLSCLQESLIGWECLQPGKGRSCRQPGKLVLPGEVSVSIEAGLKEKELLEALQPLKEERLLMFTDMRQAFGGFSSPKDAERCAPHLMLLHTTIFGWWNVLTASTTHRGHVLLSMLQWCLQGLQTEEKVNCSACCADLLLARLTMHMQV